MESTKFDQHDCNQANKESDFVYKSIEVLAKLIQNFDQIDSDSIFWEHHFDQLSLNTKIQTSLQKVKEHGSQKRLFHLDIKNQQFYVQVIEWDQRIITKKCLLTKQTLLKWVFNLDSSEQKNAVQIFGKKKYLEMIKKIKNKQITLQKIKSNCYNNVYFKYQHFQSDLIELINLRLLQVYTMQMINKFQQPYNQKLRLKIWLYYSNTITLIWKQIRYKLMNGAEVYNKLWRQDIQTLFSKSTYYKCQNADTQRPKNQNFYKNQTRKQLTKAIQHHDFQNKDNFGSHKKININDSFLNSSYILLEGVQTFLFDIDDVQNESERLSVNSGISKQINQEQPSTLQQKSRNKRFPLPENYEYLQDYQCQTCFSNFKTQSQYLRKSLKRPANSCNQHCSCMQDEGSPCPNIEHKIQCQNHSCRNSSIRQCKQIVCWYLDNQKNLQAYDAELKNAKLQTYQLQQYYSYGLDFYTVQILYYLLPFRCENLSREKSNNQVEKNYLISTLIPNQVVKTQNLYQAIYNIANNAKYEKYRFQAQILWKKIKYIQNLGLKCCMSQIIHDQQHQKRQNIQLPAEKTSITILNAYYKGLGVKNTGVTIQKGKFVAKFVGQLLEPWRQQQKQEVIKRISEFGYKQEKPSHLKFYCISVLSHFDQQGPVKSFSIDPQNKGNFCRSLNHSCNPNCKVQPIVSQGQYVLAVITIKQIKPDEQLTFDYNSVTDNLEQYKKSVCLCGSLNCRGRFFKYNQKYQNILDVKYLQVQFPIYKRIQDLVQCCYFSRESFIKNISLDNLQDTPWGLFLGLNQEIKKILLSGKQDIVEEKIKELIESTLLSSNISLDMVKKPIQNWFLLWLGKTYKFIQNQLQYTNNENKNTNKEPNHLRYSQCDLTQVLNQCTDYAKKQKITLLNAKIQKTYHFLESITNKNKNKSQRKQLIQPFKFYPKQYLLQHLQFILNNQLIQKDIFHRRLQNQIIFPLQKKEYLKRIKIVRQNLLKLGLTHIKCQNIEKGVYYLRKAFTFLLIIPYQYPDYKSQLVTIWRQNQCLVTQSLTYFGKNLYIIENLTTWSGQLKILEDQQEDKLQDDNILNNSAQKGLQIGELKKDNQNSNHQYNNQNRKSMIQKQYQKVNKLKNQYFSQQISIATSKFQQKLFQIQKPHILYQKQNFHFNKPSSKIIMKQISGIQRKLNQFIKKQIILFQQILQQEQIEKNNQQQAIIKNQTKNEIVIEKKQRKVKQQSNVKRQNIRKKQKTSKSKSVSKKQTKIEEKLQTILVQQQYKSENITVKQQKVIPKRKKIKQ